MQKTNSPHRIIRLPEVLNITGLSRSSIFRFRKLGLFPQPVKIGILACGYLSTDIDAWLSERTTASVVTH